MKRCAVVIGIVFVCLSSVAGLASADESLAAVQRAIRAQGAHWTADTPVLSEFEFQARLMHIPFARSNAATPPAPRRDLPATLDWRTQNAVTAVKDQGNCGSCWAFAAVGCLESAAIRQGNFPPTLDLSEQDIVSCDTGDMGCEGGLFNTAVNYLTSSGVVDESCDPYRQGMESVQVACELCGGSPARTYTTGANGSVSQDVDSLKQALNDYGPIAVGFNVYNDFMYYKGGIYQHTTGNYDGGHGVLIVGYDDTNQCFIVKNSWGTYWGEQGFFRIAYTEVTSATQFGQDAIWMSFGSGPTPPAVTPPDVCTQEFNCHEAAAGLTADCNVAWTDTTGAAIDKEGLSIWCTISDNLFGCAGVSPFWECAAGCTATCDTSCLNACLLPADPGGGGCQHTVYQYYACNVPWVLAGTKYTLPALDLMAYCPTHDPVAWSCWANCAANNSCSSPPTAAQTKALAACAAGCGSVAPDDDDDAWTCTTLQEQDYDNSGSGLIAMTFLGPYMGYEAYLADDFTVPAGAEWQIDQFLVAATTPTGTPQNSRGLHAAIYADQDGKPDGYPGSGTPVWSEDYQASDANLQWDLLGNITVQTQKPPTLATGRYWFLFYVDMDMDNELPWTWGFSATKNGQPAMILNPSGFEGFGKDWTPAGVVAKVSETDLAFTLYACHDDDNDTNNDNDDDNDNDNDAVDDDSAGATSQAAGPKHGGCGC